MEAVKSVGQIVHVFVDRNTGRPATSGMDDKLRNGLQKLLVEKPQSKL
jgi:acyl-CoA thioester hydrolase